MFAAVKFRSLWSKGQPCLYYFAIRLKICDCYCIRHCSSLRTVRIGDATVKINPAKNPELVPRGYVTDVNKLTQNTLWVLRWMLQKNELKQDVFLIGFPGVRRRRLVMQYLELCEKEYEYLALTRDITEADIKQRREIREGSAFYVDQAAIRAALNGRVLILDGIEKAERNVLPILNNLLENREVQLDDGRFLVAPEKYDKLLKEHSQEELKNYRLVRVNENFRVIALGLPIPKFRGYSLDPPLRSRFQSRNVDYPPFQEQYDELVLTAPNVNSNSLSELLSFVYGLLAEESASLGLPEFPVDNLRLLVRLWNNNPDLSTFDALKFLYPYSVLMKKENRASVENILKNFGIEPSGGERKTKKCDLTNVSETDDKKYANISLLWNGKEIALKTFKGIEKVSLENSNIEYVPTTSQEKSLCEMIMSHSVHDFCLIGSKDCGKTALVKKFAAALGYDVTSVMLYQDMTSRDLVQQRKMLPNGDTVWRHAPLVDAALDGGLAVLDGIHRVHHSTLNAIFSFVHDREIELFDGTRLMRRDRYEKLKQVSGLTDEQLAERKILPVHPAFRIIALAEPPNVSDMSQQWLTPELLNLFLYHRVDPLSAEEEKAVLSGMVTGAPEKLQSQLLNFIEKLRKSEDTNLNILAKSLSTRQVLRIVRRSAKYPDESLRDAIHKACLGRFLPHLTKLSLNAALDGSKILAGRNDKGFDKKITCSVSGDTLTLGNTTAPINQSVNRTLVPDIVFYDNIEHLKILEDTLRDYLLGEHLLLVGNQGVGKNKVVDRFLQLLNLPRQYIQLHRDTTVQTLTVQVTVRDGVIVYEDSPLVKAVRDGQILVIDEGDKAPTHVTVILKSLLESGHMHLADGRQIFPHDSNEVHDEEQHIRMHENFRVIVLANRPGFPFLGNDFYSALGDLFACHVVDNPSTESELEMLQRYGPNVDLATLKKLSAAFTELRSLADQGSLTYPYSTRELVNIVKHLQLFPNESLPAVVRNVFDFDSFDKSNMDTIVEILNKHGIEFGQPVTGDPTELKIIIEEKESGDLSKLTEPKFGVLDPTGAPHHGGTMYAGGTGGYNTAGLGGVGGPYRLDLGHQVYQMPQHVKDQVPEHIRKKAREMARQAWKQRLKEIQMSEFEAELYSRFHSQVEKHIARLRVIIDSLQAKGKERQWVRHQTSGDLDESKIIDGITGDKTIYRKRAEKEPEPGTPQQKPKRLRIVADVSGSMYRFNGYDRRLERSLEACLMAMEAFEGYGHKIKYDIFGHSGEDAAAQFSHFDRPPTNDKERLDVLKTMIAHSQFCVSGDNTLEATHAAVKDLAKEQDMDERFVIMLSDANFDRYNISPHHFARLMTSDENVNVFAIFIGSLGNQAEKLKRSLPPGKAFICKSADDIPQIMQQIFSSTLTS